MTVQRHTPTLLSMAMIGLTLTTLSACSGLSASSESSTASTTQVQATASTMTKTITTGEHLLVLPGHHSFSIGPDSPAQLTDTQTGQPDWQASWRGELLDAREMTANGQTVIKIVSLDQQNQLHLLTLVASTDTKSGYTLQQDAVSAPLQQPLEGLCLYAPLSNSQPANLQLFLLGEDAMARQLVLNPAANGSASPPHTTQLNTTLLRQFATAPGAQYCVADDQRDTLYISEESVGVWRMNARAESDAAREMIDLTHPFGHIQGQAGAITLSQGSLWLAESEGHRLHQYQQDNGRYLGHTLLAETIAIDTLLTLPQDTRAGALDKHSGSLITLELPSLPAIEVTDVITTVVANGETQPVKKAGDAADDPAIWVNPNQPDASRVLGTNKKQGLYVYDLDGTELQELLVDRVNNVDLRQGFHYRNQPMDIAAASQRDRHSIALFRIQPQTGVVSSAGEIVTTLDDVYGLCMYQNRARQVFVFINDQDGRYQQYQILDSATGWQGQLVREFAVASQPEGCAADDRAQRLFVGEENRAVWTLPAEPDATTEMLEIASVGEWLHADIEGMDIYQTATANYLLVSSQGNDSYVLFNATPPYQYIGRFRVGLNAAKGIDGASETDGLTISSAFLGDQYPLGMLVVQDGRNLMPEQNQNFKYIDWREIKTLFDLQ
ncbi:phytase [Candidatus Thalassolituus haligoni]|uniref:phytase n=1 Tax=Candidatus Thalassolituus haligoni TaxID=3100113 RepID=UPI00351674A4